MSIELDPGYTEADLLPAEAIEDWYMTLEWRAGAQRRVVWRVQDRLAQIERSAAPVAPVERMNDTYAAELARRIAALERRNMEQRAGGIEPASSARALPPSSEARPTPPQAAAPPDPERLDAAIDR